MSEREQPKRVRIMEVGPRDGLQNEHGVVSVEQKVELINRLVNAGLKEIEIGSFVHPGWVPQMADTDEVAAQLDERPGVRYWGLVPNFRGFERAVDAGIRFVAVVMSASETHNRKNLNRSRKESLEEIGKISESAHQRGVKVRAYISTVFGCPYEGEIELSQLLYIGNELIQRGVMEVALGDTVGMGTPLNVQEVCARFLDVHGDDKVALHLHDTRGLGLVNAMAALKEGVRTFDSSIGGMGGCPYAPGAAGNLGTEDLVNMLDSVDVESGAHLDRLIETSRWISDKLGIHLTSKYFRYAVSACPIN